MRQAMESVGLGSVDMWNNPEDGMWIYTKTMRVASFMWQIWKRGVLGLLLLSSLPILLPVLLLAFGVGFIFLLPLLPGVAAYFILSHRFPALRISGWYRYLTFDTPGVIASADTGVLEDERSIVYEDDNIQPEESQEAYDGVGQPIEEESVSDTWSKLRGEGVEGDVCQEVSELSRDPSFRPSPVEGVANAVQEGKEQPLSPKQHDVRSIEEEAGERMDHERGPEIQGLHPAEVLSSENGIDESSMQEYVAADVSSESSMPVEDFEGPCGGHNAIEEAGKENADLSFPADDVRDELASSEGDQGDEGKILFLEKLSPSRRHKEELDGMQASQEGENEVVTGEKSPVEAIQLFDSPLSSEQLLPSRPHHDELDDKDVDEEEEKEVLTGEASPAEEAALDSDIPSPPKESLSPKHDHLEEHYVKDVDDEGEKALIGDASPAQLVSGSDLLTRSQQPLPSRPWQEEVDEKDAEDEEEEKALTGEASPPEAISGSDFPCPSEQLLPSRPHQEGLDGKDVYEVEEKDLTGEASPAEAISGSHLPLSSEQSLLSRQQHEEFDSKYEREEKQEKALTGEESPAEAALDSDIPSPSEESLLSRHEHQEEPAGKDVEDVEEEKALIGEASLEEAASDSDIPSPFEEMLQSRPQQEELDAKDAKGVEGGKALTGEASPAQAVSGSDLPTPSKRSLPSRQSQEAVDGIVAAEEEGEKVLPGQEGEEVSRTNLPIKKMLQQEEIDSKDVGKKEDKNIIEEESVAEAALGADIPFPSEESLPPGQHRDAEELDGKYADEEEEKKVLREEEPPAEAVSPFDVVSEPLPSKSEDGEAGQVTKEQKSIGEREPLAEESPNFESPSEYDSTQDDEEGVRLEETVATNLPADQSLAQGESHKQRGGDLAVENEAAPDIFLDFESDSEEDDFLSPGVSISEGFSGEELGSIEPVHLQPPGGQDEQVPHMGTEPEEKEEGKYFAQASSEVETTSEVLASANHGVSQDKVLDKEVGVESTVTDSASENPWPAGVHSRINISKPDEEEDKMAFHQQPAKQELTGPDYKHLEEDQKQLDINVATEKDELHNLKGNKSQSGSEDVSLSNVHVEELTKDRNIGSASEHLSLSRNDDKELIKNESLQEESQEEYIKPKDSASYDFETREEKNKKAVTDINGEGMLVEKNVHVEEPKSTTDISLNLNAKHPTIFPVSDQTSDSGPTPEYPRECDKKHESGGFLQVAQKDTQPKVAQEAVTPEEEESNTAHFMEQQGGKSPSPVPPNMAEDTREESTPGLGLNSSGLAKEAHLQSGYLPELEIDDGELLNETEVPGGMLLPEQEQRQNVESSSESTPNMPEEPSCPSKTTTSRDQGFAEGQQPGPLSPQLAPNNTVTEGDGSQHSPSQESSHIAHSLRLEAKTLEENTAANQHEVHIKERNQEVEKLPSSQGSKVAGGMEVLSDDENEESSPFGKPTLIPRRQLSSSEAGDEVAVANLGVLFSEEHNDPQPDHKELSINTSEYRWPSNAEEHGLNGTSRIETKNEESVADKSTRTTQSEEPIPAQKPSSSNPVSEHPISSLPDCSDHPEDSQISCRKRQDDESRPHGVSPTEPSLESPTSEAITATSTPPFGPPLSQQQKSRTGRRRLAFPKKTHPIRHSAPELVQTQTLAADSATSPPHEVPREFKKAKYMDQPDVKEPMTRTPSALIPSGEVVRQLCEEISTIKSIVGQDIPLQDSLWEDVEALSQILGVQLQNMEDVSDLVKARQGLELLKAVVGIK